MQPSSSVLFFCCLLCLFTFPPLNVDLTGEGVCCVAQQHPKKTADARWATENISSEEAPGRPLHLLFNNKLKPPCNKRPQNKPRLKKNHFFHSKSLFSFSRSWYLPPPPLVAQSEGEVVAEVVSLSGRRRAKRSTSTAQQPVSPPAGGINTRSKRRKENDVSGQKVGWNLWLSLSMFADWHYCCAE